MLERLRQQRLKARSDEGTLCWKALVTPRKTAKRSRVCTLEGGTTGIRTVSAVTEELTAAASSVPDMTSRPKGVPLASLYLECDGMHKKVTQETFCAWRKWRKGQSRF